MKVIICGDRNWNDWAMIRHYILSLPKDTLIIQGECRGADYIAKQTAKQFGYPTTDKYRANWELYDSMGYPKGAAGPIRNRKMLEEKPDLVVAFHDNLAASKGTKDMLDAAKKASVKTLVFSHGMVLS
jgi:hypothetical protein